MANKEHLSMLRQGVAIWNQWREDKPEISPELRNTDLSHADLSNANLSEADLSDADLTGADLRSTNLSRSDLTFADFSKANLRGADLSRGNLSGADLYYADLSKANLHETALSEACLVSVNLRGAYLRRTELTWADLSSADLSEAYLGGANFSHAILRDTQLHGTYMSYADLSRTYLSGADLSHADLTEAQIGWTTFSNVDLSEVKGLETIKHLGPSSIGIDTIYRSKGNIPYKFLLDAGVPKDDIAYLLSLAGKAIDFYSCFISYSNQDKPFAERLHADLQAKGIRTWYAPEDLTIGEPFLLGIDKGIRLHDKLLLVLSEHSIGSGWVQHEVLSAMAKEQGKEPWVLFPIRLDDTVMNTHVPWANMLKQSRHIGDFTQWKAHDAYQKAFDRLLRDLKTQ